MQFKLPSWTKVQRDEKVIYHALKRVVNENQDEGVLAQTLTFMGQFEIDPSLFSSAITHTFV